jgi:RNA-dependent RNA polymerase
LHRLFRAIDLPALTNARNNRRHERRIHNEEQARTIDDIFLEINQEPSYSYDPIEVAVENHIRSSEYISLEPITREEVEQAQSLFQTHVNQTYSACAAHALVQTRTAMLTEQGRDMRKAMVFAMFNLATELLVGTIVAKSSQPRRRSDLMSKVRRLTAQFAT